MDPSGGNGATERTIMLGCVFNSLSSFSKVYCSKKGVSDMSFNLCKPPKKSVSLKNRFHGVISGTCPDIYAPQSSGFVCVQFEAN